MSPSEMLEQEMKERAEHRDALISINNILNTKDGKFFVKYLLKNFDVGEMPEFGLTGDSLMDRIGFLRAGNSVFKIIAEANSDIAASILAQIEREKHAQVQLDKTR